LVQSATKATISGKDVLPHGIERWLKTLSRSRAPQGAKSNAFQKREFRFLRHIISKIRAKTRSSN